MITFCHRFPSGLRCVIHADDEPPADGSAHQLQVRWSGGKMKKRYVAEYLEFTKHVNQTCADTWKRIAYCVAILMLALGRCWGFAPGEEPELVKGGALMSRDYRTSPNACIPGAWRA